MANRNSTKDEPLYVLENYYYKNGPSFTRVLASWLLDIRVAYENSGYEMQDEYQTASNYIRDMIKCTTVGRGALCQEYLAEAPEDHGWEYLFVDMN